MRPNVAASDELAMTDHSVRIVRFDESSGELPEAVFRAPGDGNGGAYVETAAGRVYIEDGTLLVYFATRAATQPAPAEVQGLVEPCERCHRGVVELLPDGARIRCEGCTAVEILVTDTGLTPDEWVELRDRFKLHRAHLTRAPKETSRGE